MEPSHKPPYISVILPFYNQAYHLEEVVTQYIAVLEELKETYEVLMVLNACRDNSLEIAEALAKRYPQIVVVNSHEGGWGLAVRLGIKKSRGEVICFTNSARTSADELLTHLIYGLNNPDAVIKANRKNRMSATRQIGSLLYNLQCRLIFNLYSWDINGTPKVFRRKHEKLLDLSRDDDLLDLEFNILCHRHGYLMLEIPTFHNKRYSGKSTTNLRSAFRMYWGAYKLWREMERA